MANNDIEFENELRNLVLNGSKIEAIKRYREATGCSLKEAKDAIDNMGSNPLPPDYRPPSVGSMPIGREGDPLRRLEEELPRLRDTVLDIMTKGNKIEAIKFVRTEIDGLGLKEAKEAVERIVYESGMAMPAKSKSFCFVATACYGSPDAPEVALLRRYRDERLVSSKLGTLFVETYYKLSPPLARLIDTHPILKRLARTLLAPVVYAVGKVMNGN